MGAEMRPACTYMGRTVMPMTPLPQRIRPNPVLIHEVVKEEKIVIEIEEEKKREVRVEDTPVV